jgi:hypothetical protein
MRMYDTGVKGVSGTNVFTLFTGDCVYITG